MSKRTTTVAVAIAGLLLTGGVAVMVAASQSAIPRFTAVASAQQGERRWSAVAPGRVEPQGGIVKLAASTVGVVRKVLVKANDTVFAGEPLIELNDDDLRVRYAAAEAQAGLRLRLRNEQPSGKSEDRRKAEDAEADAETAVFDAQNAVDKAAVDWRSGSGSAAALTEARAALARAEAELADRRAKLRSVLATAPLPSPLEAQLAAARSDLAAARVNLEKLKIRAPIDGTVLQVNVNPGELAAPSALPPLLLMANLTVLNVRAELDERDLPGIKIGQPAMIRAAAFPGREFAGTVTAIAPLVEASRLGVGGQGSRSDVDSVAVTVRLAQPGPLTTGMRVDVFFGQEKSQAKSQPKPGKELSEAGGQAAQ